MEQIRRVYDLTNENVTVIIMLNNITKEIICSPDGDKNFFETMVGVLEQDRSATCLFIKCLDNVLRTSIHLIKMALRSKKAKEDNIPQKL